MKGSQYILLLCWLCLLPVYSRAQERVWEQVQTRASAQRAKAGVLKNKAISRRDRLMQWGLDNNFRHMLTAGGSLNSNGWTAMITYQHRSVRGRTRFYRLAVSEFIHEKQIRQEHEEPADGTPQTRPYFFGKINNLYNLDIGHGRHFMLLPGLFEGNLSVGLRAQAGFSMALLKPYYMVLNYASYRDGALHTEAREERYGPDNGEVFLNNGSISGAGGWRRGLDQIKYIPGAYAGLAVCIEPVKHKLFVQQITLGGRISMYTSSMPVMALQTAYPWQACLYAGISFGKQW